MSNQEILASGGYDELLAFIREKMPQDREGMSNLMVASRTSDTVLYRIRNGKNMGIKPSTLEGLLPHIIPGAKFAIVQES